MGHGGSCMDSVIESLAAGWKGEAGVSGIVSSMMRDAWDEDRDVDVDEEADGTGEFWGVGPSGVAHRLALKRGIGL